MEPIEVELGDDILAASIVNHSQIQAVGQELGAIYEFTAKTDDGASIFNQDWDAGTE